MIDTDYYDGDLFETERKTKPFNWQKAFPEVFKIKPADPNQELKYHVKKVEALQKDTNNLIEKIKDEIEEPKERYGVSRGFDCVIGNPPYVRQELLGIQKNYFELRYRVYHGMADLYSYFIERGITLLNDNGIFGIIVANKWMRANYGEPLRKWLKQQTIHEIIDFGDLQVFESVTTYPCILIAGKPSKNIGSIDVTNVKSLSFDSLQNYVQQNRELILKNSLDDSGWNLASETETNLLDKLKQNSKPLGKYVDGKIYRGVLTGLSEAFVIDESTKDQLIVEDYKNTEVIKPFLAGRDIKRYQPVNFNKYLIFFPKGYTNKKGNYPKNAWKWLQEYYPSIANYLEPYKAKGEKRFDKGDYCWELRACDYYDEFENPKIIYQVFQVKPCFVWDENGCYCNNSIWIIPQNDKYLLAILNSSLGWYMISTYCTKIQNGYQLIYKYFEKLLIKNIDFSIQEEKSNHDKIINQVDQLLQLNQEKQDCKLESRLNQIQSKIDYCEDRINAIVYELYGLTEEEIKIVEGK